VKSQACFRPRFKYFPKLYVFVVHGHRNALTEKPLARKSGKRL
jgi:hypothetical protein